MSDELNIGFQNTPEVKEEQKSSIHMRGIDGRLKDPSKPKRKYKLTRIAAVVAMAGGFTVGAGFLLTARNGEEMVLHSGDTLGNGGEVSHWHELTETDFKRDFLYLNPGATDEQIMEAMTNGEYQYYLENDGKIKEHPTMTAFHTGYKTRDRYENEVVPRIEALEENTVTYEAPENSDYVIKYPSAAEQAQGEILSKEEVKNK